MKNKQLDSSTTGGNLPRFPLLPLRDIVIFPRMVVPLFVGRQKSILALEAAMNGNKYIFLATQKNAMTEEPMMTQDIHSAGTLCQILQLLKLPDGTVKVLVEGKKRGVVVSHSPHDGYYLVEVEIVVESDQATPQMEALIRGVSASFESYAKSAKTVSPEVLNSIVDITDPGLLSDSIVAHLKLKIEDKQELLAARNVTDRLEKLLALMQSEIEILQIEKKIHTRVKKQMEKAQREYYLNEQMRAIQKELGGNDQFKEEIRDIEERITSLGLSSEAKQKAFAELKKLKLMSPMSAEAAVVRNYVDWLVSLPWEKCNREKHDIREAATILDTDHYGLVRVKERILECLSVSALVKKLKGPILCFVGPPGVGKTSLARSIARATGRDFIKMSLGGVRDEAEIRGHRRTYIGAMPGKIIQSLKKAGSNNPVFLLDEIDKMSSDFRGDPASALLEVLDPEQNFMFCDHFLDVEYDLSRVMFITTANSLHSIPRPLLDRLEIIRLEGYLEKEKLNIARHYLIGKQLSAHGLKKEDVALTDKAILDVIRFYTREAGVRHLDREIATMCRKIAHKTVKGERKKFLIQPRHVKEFLGVQRHKIGMAEEKDAIGVVTGLAWTEVGGELLNVEVAVLPGKGKLTITGKLGEVMQESAHAAMTYVRSRGRILGLKKDFYQELDIHIHLPEGAIPKDGPSAGISMATAIISALTGRAVRRDIAMTGEITLRGRVLGIGGLKEKLLAARRGQIRTVIVPKDNEKDLADVPNDIVSGLVVKCITHMDDVVSLALLGGAKTDFSLDAITMGKTDEVSGDAVMAH